MVTFPYFSPRNIIRAVREVLSTHYPPILSKTNAFNLTAVVIFIVSPFFSSSQGKEIFGSVDSSSTPLVLGR